MLNPISAGYGADGLSGAGSVLQHVVARNGRTNPPLFRAAMSSSSFLPSQHPFDGAVPEV